MPFETAGQSVPEVVRGEPPSDALALPVRSRWRRIRRPDDGGTPGRRRDRLHRLGAHAAGSVARSLALRVPISRDLRG
ncbi:hypothetical protein FTX61_15740 [Nitriliruptoraceae bacterium ZYF776]|nr:hypothetical protein [Profundirhabdus halotolerans]